MTIQLNEESPEFAALTKEWLEEAKDITIETLPAFITKLTTEYTHDYGTICHAMAIGAEATMWAINKSPQGGITGFQASAVMWKFIRNWTYQNNRLGLSIIDYDKLLYPQYADAFTLHISAEQHQKIKETAAALLKNTSNASNEVIEHWKKLAAGTLPFGLTRD